jgi:uncharacterized RDD family membrane protein YckC
MASISVADAPEGRTVRFLPRFGALLLDLLVVIAAVQFLVTAAHHLSRGHVQGAAGLALVNCWPINDIPALTPPPPAHFNFAYRCERSLLGLDMANWISMGKVTSRDEGRFETEGTQFALSPNGDQVLGPTIISDSVTILSLFLYLAVADWIFGATAGKWMMGLRTVEVDKPHQRGLSFPKAFVRGLAMHAGILAGTVILAAYQIISADMEGSLTVGRALYALVLGWILWNSGRLLIGSEALYDLAAGTTVVRRRD